MPDSETTIVRKELVKVVREKDQLEKDHAGYKDYAEARFLAYEREIADLKMNAAANAGPCPRCAGGQDPKGQDTSGRAESDLVKELRGQIKEANRKLDMYDNHNNPGAKDYNRKRAEFRKKHGTYDKQAGTRRIGPPAGHKGVSHSRKADESAWYALDACPTCGSAGNLSAERPSVKLLVERDKTVAVVAERAWCCRCRKIVVADSPSIKGTHMGPRMLGIVAEYTAEHATDRATSRFLERLHGLRVCPNSVLSARTALTLLWEKLALLVRDYIIEHATYVHRDEMPIIIAGKIGYVWLVCWGPAVFIVVAGSRARAVLDVFFSGMHDIPSITDEYAVYVYLPVRQSCLIHILRRAEKCAVRSGKGSDLIPYLLLLGIYFRIKYMDTAPPDVIAELEGQVRAIADMYGEGHEISTALTNSLPTMFTFLKHPGMPPHNNRAEQEIHAGPAREKRVRRQLKNHNGMRCMSVLSTVFRTAENLGVWPSTVVRMTARDRNWDMFAHADGPGPPLGAQARRPAVFSGAAA